jgi:hypothetical protein
MIGTGVHKMDLASYLAHPALSSSGARKLLPPSCPALFHYERTNPIQASPEMEFGSVTHELLFGDGRGYVVLEYDSYRTKAAREDADLARSNGQIPILEHDMAVAKAMVSVLRAHPIAGKAVGAGGDPEQTLIWDDKSTGVQLRARIDYAKRDRRGRLVAVDYKTASSAAPEKIGKSSWDYGYAQQDDWYRSGIRALGLDADPGFLLITQMKEPPYLVTVGQYDEMSMAIARELNRRAIQKFAECTERNEWPGFDDGIATLSLPGWVHNQWMKDML